MHRIIAASALIALGGCASVPVPYSEAKPTPNNKQILFAEATPSTVPVTLIRDRQFVGSICATKIMVDEKVAAYVGVAERVTLNIPVGEVILGAEPAGICNGGLAEHEVNLTPGKPLYFRISISQNAETHIYRTIP